MTLIERYPEIGWRSLLEKLEAVDTELRENHRVYTGVKSIERHNGMLKVVFRFNVPEYVLCDIQEAIAYRFERLSARMCEDCGEFGLRRTELKETRTLCTTHYALRYSEEHPVPSSVANQEPHKDWGSMFYREEDIQPVVDVVTQMLGPQGTMMSGKNISKNVVLGSPELGKLWYGDVDGDMEYVRSICNILSQRTSQKISVVSESF